MPATGIADRRFLDDKINTKSTCGYWQVLSAAEAPRTLQAELHRWLFPKENGAAAHQMLAYAMVSKLTSMRLLCRFHVRNGETISVPCGPGRPGVWDRGGRGASGMRRAGRRCVSASRGGVVLQ